MLEVHGVLGAGGVGVLLCAAVAQEEAVVLLGVVAAAQ